MTRAQQVLSECARLWAPPPKQSLSDWAEEHFILSSEYSASSGRLQLYRFQRGILDAFTDPHTRGIVVMTATQLIKTLLQQVAIAYVIARAPGPILAAQPTETDAETFSKERLSPMIRDMECLRTRVAPEKRTSKSNTTLHKVFPGGSLSLIGAQTSGNFARRAIRYFFADELDKWPVAVGREGDGFSLGVKRTATFRSLAKIIQTCSPTIEGSSQIAAAYADSDQRKFYVPCPRCGEAQVLCWAQVRWDPASPAATAHYECAMCAGHWSDVDRWNACERGEWRAGLPFAGTAGFWISELYSPWKRLGDIVADFLAKKDNPVEYQTFVNTTLAETWKQQGEAPDHEKLMARREECYRLGQVPDGVTFLTCGADVQKTWIEGYVWGWSRGKQRWLIDRWRVEGDPYNPTVWPQVTERLNSMYRSAGGIDMPIVMLAIDSGHATQEVYAWCRQQGSGRVMAVDGRHNGPSLLMTPTQVDVTVRGKKIKHGAKLWPVNVSMAKSELYGQLQMDRPEEGEPYPAGWVHFPSDIDEEFFKQLTAEQLTAHVVKGYRRFEWVKMRERNEALDCANYARAAACACGIDRFGANRWLQLEANVRATSGAPPPPPRAPVVQPPPEEQAPPPPQPQVAARQQERYVGRFNVSNWLSR